MKKVIFLFEERDRQRDEYSAAVIWWYGILEMFGYDVMYYDYRNFKFDDFYKEAKSFRPDFIFHPTYSGIHTDFLKLNEFAKTYVIHSDDDYRFDDHAKFWAPFVTGTITYCGGDDYMKKLYQSVGISNSRLIKAYWPFNPATMAHSHKNERDVNCCHVGSIYGERLPKLHRFSEKNFPITVYENKLYSEFKELLSKSKFSLSFTKSSNHACNQVKGRIFEIPFSSVLVTEPFPDMEKYYDLEKELVVFNSVDEACDKMNRLIQDNRVEEVFNNGRHRLLSEHTAFHVWQNRILPFIDEDFVPTDISKILSAFKL